jgi:hypothetical protein
VRGEDTYWARIAGLPLLSSPGDVAVASGAARAPVSVAEDEAGMSGLPLLSSPGVVATAGFSTPGVLSAAKAELVTAMKPIAAIPIRSRRIVRVSSGYHRYANT